jgi:hypothetical protein
MILEIFEYFARFPRRQGVIDAFANGSSCLPLYGDLLNRVSLLPPDGLIPDIYSYVFGADMDTVKRRVDAIDASYLFIDFGEIESSRDARNSINDSMKMAATVAYKIADTADIIERTIFSHSSLCLVNRLRVLVYAEAAAGLHPWLMTVSHRLAIIPFISPELNSIGWTLIFSSQAADMFNLKPQINALTS